MQKSDREDLDTLLALQHDPALMNTLDSKQWEGLDVISKALLWTATL